MKKYFSRHIFCGGFTLVELLVAATIIGFLVVFATNSYRSGVAETRWAQAKANTDQLAAAVQRIRLDYPYATFSTLAMNNTTSSSCPLGPGKLMYVGGYSPSSLIACGYLENGEWGSEYFQYYVCDKKTTSPCISYSGNKPVACVGVRANAKVPSKYKSYTYCFYGRIGGVENPS